MTIISCGFWLLLLLFIVFTVDRLFVKGMKLGAYRYFVGPAALLHGVSQVLACMLTGAKVKSVLLANHKSGRVEHEKPRLRGVGDVFIAVAPLLACGAVLVFLPRIFSRPLHIASPLPMLVDMTPQSLTDIVHGLITSCREAALYLTSTNYSFAFAAFLYIGLIFTIGIAPDRGKFKYAAFCVVLLTAIMYFADGAMNHAAENFAANVLWGPLSFALPISILFLGVALVLSVFVSALKTQKKPEAVPKPATA